MFFLETPPKRQFEKDPDLVLVLEHDDPPEDEDSQSSQGTAKSLNGQRVSQRTGNGLTIVHRSGKTFRGKIPDVRPALAVACVEIHNKVTPDDSWFVGQGSNPEIIESCHAKDAQTSLQITTNSFTPPPPQITRQYSKAAKKSA